MTVRWIHEPAQTLGKLEAAEARPTEVRWIKSGSTLGSTQTLGATSPFEPADLFAQWQTWIPICEPFTAKGQTCPDPGKIAAVKLVQAALTAAGFNTLGVDGTWGTNSRNAWKAFASANPGVTPSGDSYRNFTLSDFETLAKKAYGWVASTAGGLANVVLPKDPSFDVNNYLPASIVGALFSNADWQLRLIQLNRLLKSQTGVELLPGFGADGSKDFTGLVSDWNNLADRTVQAYTAFTNIPEVAALGGDSNLLYQALAVPTQNVVGDAAAAQALINSVNGAAPVVQPAAAVTLSNGKTFDPAQVAKDWKQWVTVNCPSDPAVVNQGLTCIDPLKINTVKLVQQALLDSGFDPKGIIGGAANTTGSYVVKAAAGPGAGSATTVTAEMNGTGANIGPREQKGGRWWTATRVAWNQMAQATGSKILGADSYKNFGLAEFQTLASKVKPGVKPQSTVTLLSVDVTPASADVQAPNVQKFTATAKFDDGSTKDVTALATWSSSSITVAGVVLGIATGFAAGSTTITATFQGKSGTATLNVKGAAVPLPQKTLVSVSVSPPIASAKVNTTQAFTATENYSDGTTVDVTASATWSSSNPSVAALSKTPGLFSALTAGAATITATSSGKSGAANVNVTAATVPTPGGTCVPGFRLVNGKCEPIPMPGFEPKSNKDFQVRLAIYNRKNPGKIAPQDYGAVCSKDISGEWNVTDKTGNPYSRMGQGQSKVLTSAALAKPTLNLFALRGTPGMLGVVGTSTDRTESAFQSFIAQDPALKKEYDTKPLDDVVDKVYGALIVATQDFAGDAAKVKALVDEIQGPCPAVKPTCGANEELDATGTKCVPKLPKCGANQTWDGTKCVDVVDRCLPGFQKDPAGTGKCIPIPCPKGQRLGPDGKCAPIICQGDTQLNAAGNACEPKPPPGKDCGAGKVWDPGKQACVPVKKPISTASAAGGDGMLGVLALVAGAGALLFLATKKDDEEEQKKGVQGGPTAFGRPAQLPASRPRLTAPTSRRRSNPHSYRF